MLTRYVPVSSFPKSTSIKVTFFHYSNVASCQLFGQTGEDVYALQSTINWESMLLPNFYIALSHRLETPQPNWQCLLKRKRGACALMRILNLTKCVKCVTSLDFLLDWMHF